MSGRRLAALFLVAFGIPGFCAAAASNAKAAWTGVVTHVSDGDTLWVRPPGGGAPRKIRLDGIDAPEICQRHGKAAAKALAQQVLHRQVRVATRASDDYARALARLSLQGEDVGGWMVGEGHAWSYRFRKNPGPYAAEESQARRARRGLFADAQALPPREFRRQHGACFDRP